MDKASVAPLVDALAKDHAAFGEVIAAQRYAAPLPTIVIPG
jgi:hypothetical protein